MPHVEEPTDVDLLHRAKAGDFESFERLVSQLQPRVYGLAFRILHQSQDAEDVTQQTFLALVEHLPGFREESSLATWVLRIATNFCLKILRKRRGSKTIALSELGPEDSYSNLPHPQFISAWTRTAEEIAQQSELRSEIEHAMQELDEKYRLVFLLRDVEGLSVRETAEAMELTESTVKVRLLRARLALRERLTSKFGDPEQALVPDHRHT
ncbi:MAG: sigma-70 family RNA polymerase sigma factor [Pirellula sp.]|jgi:RNA polymerase sigma-70 factor (ECF subfamily)|nr:sigma-70 family RNA polymerase sigma factor [Pirellula sp.]